MTILDIQANFSDTGSGSTTSIVGAAGTYLCVNTYDTGPLAAYFSAASAADTTLTQGTVNAGRDMGGGERLWILINMIVAGAGGTNANFQFVTQSASTLASPTVLAQTGTIVTATLVAGYRTLISVPRNAAYARYIGVQAVTTGTYTTGTFTAALVKDADATVLGYGSGFGIK